MTHRLYVGGAAIHAFDMDPATGAVSAAAAPCADGGANENDGALSFSTAID